MLRDGWGPLLAMLLSFFLLFFSVHYCNYVLCRASRSNFTARTREPKYRKNLWKCEKMSWKERQQLTEAWVWLTGLKLELRVWEQIARILEFFCLFFFYAATVHIQCCVVYLSPPTPESVLLWPWKGKLRSRANDDIAEPSHIVLWWAKNTARIVVITLYFIVSTRR